MRAATHIASKVAARQRAVGGCGGGVGSAAAAGRFGRAVNLQLRSATSQRTVHVRGFMVAGGAGNAARRAGGGLMGSGGGVAATGARAGPRFIRVQRVQFREFFGGGGMPGGGGGGGDTELYERLGVKKDATDKEIKTAFRKLAMKHHPDQGGDAERFTKIQEAYEVLGDKEKRQQYDQFGKAAVDGSFGEGGGMHGGFEGFDVNDVFSQFFGGGGGGRRRGPVRTEDMTYNLAMDLEALYTGTTKKIAVNRNALCGTCDGLGAASVDDVTTCGVCGGRGVVITTRQLGPMVQQVQQECHACGGEGKVIAPGKQCSTCGGQKVVRERKTFDVNIKPGTLPNSRLVLRGESNQMPGATPGDVCLIIGEKPHPHFRREGNDLIYEHQLSLAEALTGFQVPVKFLDGKTLLLQNDAADAPIRTDTINRVRGKGMKSAGDLYVVWRIDMPHQPFDEETKAQLRSLLGAPPAPAAEELEGAERVTLELSTQSQRNQRQRQQQRGGGGGGGGGGEEEGANCRQM